MKLKEKLAQEFLNQNYNMGIRSSVVFGKEDMERIATFMWNAALEWAANNADVAHIAHRNGDDYDIVDQQSILAGKDVPA